MQTFTDCRRAFAEITDPGAAAEFVAKARTTTAGRHFIMSPEWFESRWYNGPPPRRVRASLDWVHHLELDTRQ